jgi:hypothetical protein
MPNTKHKILISKIKGLFSTRKRRVLALGTLAVFVAGISILLFTNRAQDGYYPIKKAGFFSPYAYAGKTHDVEVSFIEKSDKDTLAVKIADKDSSVTFAPIDTSGSVKLKSQNHKLASDNSFLTFSDVYPETDITYQLIRNGVKEDIVVKSKDAALPVYTFLFELDGLKPIETELGQLLPIFVPVNSNYSFNNGQPQTEGDAFRILPLYMKDALGEVSYDIGLAIHQTPGEGVYEIQIFPSQEWLMADERIYPVTIDPTVIKGDPPLAHWGINEAYGTTLNDSSGNGKSLTTNGPVWHVDNATSGNMVGYVSLLFDGTNDYASRAYDSGFDFGTGSFSISGWFKHTSTISGTDVLLARYSGAGFKVYMNSSGQICFGIDDDATWTPDDEVCSAQSLADSKWHHISAVKSTTSSITLYIDGVQVGQDASLAAIGSLSGSSPVLYLGIDSDGTSNPWHGFIDQLTIYDYALDAAQVKADAMATPQTAASFGGPVKNNLTNGLVGYWPMDEASWDGTTGEVVDYSGNGNHGASATNDSGTSSGSNTSTTLNDTSKSWTVDAYADHNVAITGGTGSGQVRTISSNTATELDGLFCMDYNPRCDQHLPHHRNHRHRQIRQRWRF